MDLNSIEKRSERHRLLLARKVGQRVTGTTFAVALGESSRDVQKLVEALRNAPIPPVLVSNDWVSKYRKWYMQIRAVLTAVKEE